MRSLLAMLLLLAVVMCSTATATAGGLYAATFGCAQGSESACTASLMRYTVGAGRARRASTGPAAGGVGSWSRSLDFATGIPQSAQFGMLAGDGTGRKWWLAAGNATRGVAASCTLFYAAAGATPTVTAVALANNVAAMQYVQAADEFVATWQLSGSAGAAAEGGHLEFGAMDPYVGRQSGMVDLTRNASLSAASSFTTSTLDPATNALTFVVAAGEGPGGGPSYSLAQVAPTGHGVAVEVGRPCQAGLAIQSVVTVPGLLNPTPLALTMNPAQMQT